MIGHKRDAGDTIENLTMVLKSQPFKHSNSMSSTTATNINAKIRIADARRASSLSAEIDRRGNAAKIGQNGSICEEDDEEGSSRNHATRQRCNKATTRP